MPITNIRDPGAVSVPGAIRVLIIGQIAIWESVLGGYHVLFCMVAEIAVIPLLQGFAGVQMSDCTELDSLSPVKYLYLRELSEPRGQFLRIIVDQHKPPRVKPVQHDQNGRDPIKNNRQSNLCELQKFRALLAVPYPYLVTSNVQALVVDSMTMNVHSRECPGVDKS